MDKQQGKEEFLTLIQNNRGVIYKICSSYCPEKNEREDLAQEIIYQLWKSWGSFNESHRFSTWMYRVALNTAISFYRKQKNTIAAVPLTETLADTEYYSSSKDEAEQKIKLVQQFINQLKELDRALMILYLEAKSYGEIAEILGISQTNVATKINRIKDRMKQNFSNIKE